MKLNKKSGAKMAMTAAVLLVSGATLIGAALGPAYTHDIRAAKAIVHGVPATVITVRVPLPIIGLVGLDEGMEVHGHAATETVG